ncbi:MAG: acyltransferase [Acidimicrobiales bacterium]
MAVDEVRGPKRSRTRQRLILLVVEPLRLTWINSLAGLPIVPAPVRYLMYRLAGFRLRTILVSPRCVFTGRQVSIGPGTFINWSCFFEGGPIDIGRDCQIGMETMIATGSHPMEDGRVTKRHEQLGVKIGDGCWLGARVTVLPGVSIAPGTVVGAGSLVNRSIDEPGIYAGVPARRIGDVPA